MCGSTGIADARLEPNDRGGPYLGNASICFFDDDIVLLPGCLTELEKPHRTFGNRVVGVGAFGRNSYVEKPFCGPSALWRFRLFLRIVPDLQPGKYHRITVLFERP